MTGTGLLAGAIAIALTTTAAAAQRIELSPFAGFQFGAGNLRLAGGDLNVQSAANFGATLDIRLASTAWLGFTYSRQVTQLEVEERDAGTGIGLFDLAIEYVHLGLSYQPVGKGIRPFARIMMGITRYNPLSSDRSSETYPSGSFGGGIKRLLTKKIGVKLEGRFLVTFVLPPDEETSFCGPDIALGCLAKMPATLIAQGNVMAGVFVAF